MKSVALWLLVLLLVAAGAAGGGYWLGHRGAGGAAAKDEDEGNAGSKSQDKPVATVTVVPLRRGSVQQQVIAYGTVIAPPSEITVVSVPFEARVKKILVTPGQVIPAGQLLVVVEGSAATSLAYEEARNAAAAAERDLQLVQQRYDQKLATNAELFTAQNALRTAQARLQNLQQSGAGGPRELKSETAGIVGKVDVQTGQIVPAGNPLVEVAPENRIEVHLGAEPEDVPLLKLGQQADLTPVDDPAATPVVGKVRLIGQRVDPMTRLVDVMVALPPDARLLLESFVTGRMMNTSAPGWLVPRDALLPGDNGEFVLFTLKDGHAVKHSVHLGIENDREAQVIAVDLKEGDPVVVEGNYELDEGTLVRVEASQSPVEGTTDAESSEKASPSTAPSDGGPTSRPATSGPVPDAEGRP
jgi:RND family efflux transporter MFP subunit